MENLKHNNVIENQSQRNSDQLVDEICIPVFEEKIKIDKRVVDIGKVRISKHVTEQEETIEIPLSQDRVDVQRVEINKYVDNAPPAVRYEGEVMIIPVLKEVLVVEKRIMLVEELHVTHKKVESVETQKVTLQKEEVHVERNSLIEKDSSNGNL